MNTWLEYKLRPSRKYAINPILLIAVDLSLNEVCNLQVHAQINIDVWLQKINKYTLSLSNLMLSEIYNIDLRSTNFYMAPFLSRKKACPHAGLNFDQEPKMHN